MKPGMWEGRLGMSLLLKLLLGFQVNEIVTVGGQPLPHFFDFTYSSCCSK